MRSWILSLPLLVVGPLIGCDRQAPPVGPSSAVAPPAAEQSEPMFDGQIEVESIDETEPLRRTVGIGPGKVTTDYQRVELGQGAAAIVIEFKFLRHEKGADHYRFGAFEGEAALTGAGAGQDVAYSGQEVTVFDQPNYKVRILPRASDEAPGS